MTALGGKCGICGDAYDASPREHEAPYGKYANGIIVRQYHEGQMIDIQIDVTANHKGYFEFKLCPNNDITQDPDQNCFDQYVYLKDFQFDFYTIFFHLGCLYSLLMEIQNMNCRMNKRELTSCKYSYQRM